MTTRTRRWRSILDRLPPLKIGRHGQLQEWNEDFEEVEPGHRHASHLIGLYPGDELDPERTPELWQAARELAGAAAGRRAAGTPAGAERGRPASSPALATGRRRGII